MCNRKWLVCLVVLGVAACGTSTEVHYGDPDGVEQDARSQTDVPGEPDQNGKVDLNLPEAPPDGWGYEIVPIGVVDGKMEVRAGEQIALAVLVINHKTDEHASSYPVAYTIGASDPECASDCATLTAQEVATASSGIASVTLLAGAAADVIYTVKISGQDAAPVLLEIFVSAKPTGDLKITFDPSNPGDLVAVPNRVKVMVGTGFKQCSQFSPIAPWTPVDYEKTVTGVGATPEFKGLDPDKTYWVTMLGWRGTAPDEHLVVYGCLDNVKVAPVDAAGETKVTLQVNTVELIPAGTYDMVNHFDFSDVAMNLPGTAGQIIYYIELVFTNPGVALLEGIKKVIEIWVPSWVTDIAFGLFQDALGNYITQWVLNNAPQAVQDFLAVGNDVLQIVNNLEMTGQLKISKLSANCMNGKEYWYGITLYWKWGCPANDEECGVYHFGLEQLDNTEFPLDLINGEWNGCIVGFDGLQIQPHSIMLNYGKLILFVLNEVMIPLVTDYDNLEDMLYSIVDCQNLAASMTSNILDGIGLSEQDIETACNQVLATMLGPVTQAISTLSLPSQVFLQGSAQFLDDDANLTVDRIVDGIWTGEVLMDGQSVGAVKGDFNATRAAYPGE